MMQRWLAAQAGHTGEMQPTDEETRQSQKMEAIGQLTAGIAHDFNNLLAVVLGNLDFLYERTREDDPLRAYICPSIEAAEHGAELTQQLLTFSRKQALQPKIIACNELLHYFSALLRHTLGERITLAMAMAPDLWNVNIDANQLQNALLNLALNARDAMPRGGKMSFETGNVTLRGDHPALKEGAAPGDYVRVTVRDTGEGMTPEIVGKVFEPFFTTKDIGKGSGLGLSMVYGFVKQSAGNIVIESEPGKGTAVTLYLPRARGEVCYSARMQMPDHRAGRVLDVLVVEDNTEVLKLTASMLESLGHHVRTATDGDAALKMIMSHPDIELLLTDVILPGTYNGPELARCAAKVNPGMKVLFNSGYPADTLRQQRNVLEPGMDLLSKPFRKQQLAEKISEIFEHAQAP